MFAEDGAREGFLRHWILTALALALTAWVLEGVRVSNALALAVAAVVLGFLNAVVKPVFVLLTLPATLFTLGLFYLVLNGLFFGLAAGLVPGFSVDSFGSAVAGALVMGIVSWLLGGVLPRRRQRHVRIEIDGC